MNVRTTPNHTPQKRIIACSHAIRSRAREPVFYVLNKSKENSKLFSRKGKFLPLSGLNDDSQECCKLNDDFYEQRRTIRTKIPHIST